MALPNSTQNRPAEQSNPSLMRKCFEQEIMIQNYSVFTHRISALEVISAALAVKAADGAPHDELVRGIAQLHKHLADVIGSAERIPYE